MFFFFWGGGGGWVVFFFQAEDGIRDRLVTGVQTCALPISLTILVDANLLYIGFNNVQHGSYTIIVIALLIFPVVFFFAYKGLKSILDAIFY